MTTTETTTRPPKNTITRRKMLQSVAVTSAATLVPVANSALANATPAHADEMSEPPFDADTDGLVGLPLAAVHIERAIEAMAPVTFGHWQVTIVSGHADQHWSFKQISPDRHDPLLDAIHAYRRGLDEFNSATAIDDDTRDALADTTYSPPMAVLDAWDRPAISQQGAVEALRLALEESHDFGGSDMVTTMLAAALGYFYANAA